MHGSAPDIGGQDIANPLAMVLSAAMMCRYGLNMPQVRQGFETALIAEAAYHDAVRVMILPCGTQQSLSAMQVAEHLEKAVTSALDQGYRTADLFSKGTQKVGCSEMGRVLLDCIHQESSASMLRGSAA